MLRISSEPIDPAKAYAMLAKKSAGSVLFHYAVVRPRAGGGDLTCHIDYATQGDAEAEMQAIEDELAAIFSIEDSLLIRRTGRLAVGEILSLVAVSSPGSEHAFAACTLGLRLLKRMKTITKCEVCYCPPDGAAGERDFADVVRSSAGSQAMVAK
jgi:molybdopterin synthase catalytic subunit